MTDKIYMTDEQHAVFFAEDTHHKQQLRDMQAGGNSFAQRKARDAATRIIATYTGEG